MINIIEAYRKRKPVKPNLTNKGTITRCPDCGAIEFPILPTIDIQYCRRCGKALDFSDIEYNFTPDEYEDEDYHLIKQL